MAIKRRQFCGKNEDSRFRRLHRLFEKIDGRKKAFHRFFPEKLAEIVSSLFNSPFPFEVISHSKLYPSLYRQLRMPNTLKTLKQAYKEQR